MSNNIEHRAFWEDNAESTLKIAFNKLNENFNPRECEISFKIRQELNRSGISNVLWLKILFWRTGVFLEEMAKIDKR